MEVVLIRVKESGEQTPVPLKHGQTLIGRLDDCQIRIPIAGISRKHCMISIEDGDLSIEDLGSSNGTYVNQDRINSSMPLSAGDLISIGGLVFVVSVNGEPEHIDGEMMFEDGLPDPEATAASKPASAVKAPASKPQTIPADSFNDESSMMDFQFDFDDDDDQPPL